jgi:hypothetical protein
MDFRPDAGLGPVAQPPPTGHAAAATQFLGQHLPGDAGDEDEEDAGEVLTVADRLTARKPKLPPLLGRQVWFDQSAQLIIQRLVWP